MENISYTHILAYDIQWVTGYSHVHVHKTITSKHYVTTTYMHNKLIKTVITILNYIIMINHKHLLLKINLGCVL